MEHKKLEKINNKDLVAIEDSYDEEAEKMAEEAFDSDEVMHLIKKRHQKKLLPVKRGEQVDIKAPVSPEEAKYIRRHTGRHCVQVKTQQSIREKTLETRN